MQVAFGSNEQGWSYIISGFVGNSFVSVLYCLIRKTIILNNHFKSSYRTSKDQIRNSKKKMKKESLEYSQFHQWKEELDG